MTTPKTSQSEKTTGAGGGRSTDSVEATHSRAAQDRLTDWERVAAETSRLGGPDPYPPYDLMSLEELREVADDLNVAIPPDVEKSLLITELRAHRSGTLSVAQRRPA